MSILHLWISLEIIVSLLGKTFLFPSWLCILLILVLSFIQAVGSIVIMPFYMLHYVCSALCNGISLSISRDLSIIVLPNFLLEVRVSEGHISDRFLFFGKYLISEKKLYLSFFCVLVGKGLKQFFSVFCMEHQLKCLQRITKIVSS